MQSVVMRFLLVAALLGGLTNLGHAGTAPLPPRDLTVELRQVVEGREDGATHYTAGMPDAGAWEPQSVLVRNGEKGMLRLMDAIPMQWTQSVSTQNTLSNANTRANTNSHSAGDNPASVTQALVWFDAGKSMSVQPSWPRAKQPVVLVLEVQAATAQSKVGTPPSTQSRNTLFTTLTVPLGEWVTVATTGRAARPSVYSSEAGEVGRRLLQVRVTAP
jgi:hypothetical protein